MKKATAIGMKGAILSSLCCVGALALVLLGVGVSVALTLTQYRPYFIALGVIFMITASWRYFRRCKDECSIDKKRFIATVLATYVIILVLLLYALVPALAPMFFQAPTKHASENVKQLTLSIEGMTCPSCAEIVENSLVKKHGIIKADVSYEKASAVVWYDPNIIEKEEIVKAVPKPYKAYIIE